MNLSSDNTVRVTVLFRGGDNKARAGSGIRAKFASSTNSPEIAAKASAAKFFRCGEHLISLKQTQDGNCCTGRPWLFTASKGGAL